MPPSINPEQMQPITPIGTLLNMYLKGKSFGFSGQGAEDEDAQRGINDRLHKMAITQKGINLASA